MEELMIYAKSNLRRQKSKSVVLRLWNIQLCCHCQSVCSSVYHNPNRSVAL